MTLELAKADLRGQNKLQIDLMESGPTVPGLVLQAKDTSRDKRLADLDGGLPNQGKPNVEEVGDTTGKQLALLLQDVQVKGLLSDILYRN